MKIAIVLLLSCVVSLAGLAWEQHNAAHLLRVDMDRQQQDMQRLYLRVARTDHELPIPVYIKR